MFGKGSFGKGAACLALCGLTLLGGGCGKAPEYSDTRLMLDTVCTVRAGGERAQAAVEAAFAKIQEIQVAVDFYDPDSTVAAFNRAEAGEAVALDQHTAAILETALEVSRVSRGAFDPTVAPVQELWPFQGQENAAPPEPEAIARALALVGWENLDFDSENRTLSKKLAGVKIDLGGAAKGYAADQARRVMADAGAEFGLLDLGGNIAVLGQNPDSRDGNWRVGLQKPFADAGVYRQVVSVASGAVVTSGTYQRNFYWQGRLYHHILDPATGYPAESGLSGVSVAAESGLLADCLSTACLVLGRDGAQALAEQYGAEVYFEEAEHE